MTGSECEACCTSGLYSHVFPDGEVWRDVVGVEVQGDELVEDGGAGAKPREDQTAHQPSLIGEPLRDKRQDTRDKNTLSGGVDGGESIRDYICQNFGFSSYLFEASLR